MINQRLKSAERQVILEKMSSDFLIQQSNAAIVVINTDFTIAEANDAYLNVVGKTKQETLGAYCYQISHGLDAPCSSCRMELKCPMIETLRTGKSAHVIHEWPGKSGRPAIGNIVTYPLIDTSGEILQVIEIWRDITEEISSRWEKRAQKLKADLNHMVQEDRMISLGKLAASCVHEINNPIQGLLTFTDLMRCMLAPNDPSAEDIDQMKKFLAIMSAELQRCGEIISGLLSFARETPLQYKHLNINDVIEAVICLTRHKMKLQNIQLDSQLATGPIMIRGDANRLQQCLLNLVFNAIEAMPGGGRLSLASCLKNRPGRLLITIGDSGHGIAENHISHIFDPFFTTKDAGQGTGLGLSIVYGVVKNHGGHIRVDSTRHQGAAFLIELPVQSAP